MTLTRPQFVCILDSTLTRFVFMVLVLLLVKSVGPETTRGLAWLLTIGFFLYFTTIFYCRLFYWVTPLAKQLDIYLLHVLLVVFLCLAASMRNVM